MERLSGLFYRPANPFIDRAATLRVAKCIWLRSEQEKRILKEFTILEL